MARFIYKAKKGPDEVSEGAFEADSENAAIDKLIRSGYCPILLREELTGKRGVSICRIKSKGLANFTRRLSELLCSGLTLYNALGVIENQADDNNLKMIVGAVKARIKDGKSFSSALRAYPNVFSELYVNLVHAGEESGALDDVLSNISDLLDRDEDIRSKVIAALAYPGLMATVGFITVFILVTFIVPRLVNMFIEMGERLPLATRMLLWAGDFIKAYWIFPALFIGGACFIFKSNRSIPAAKNNMDRIKLRMPVFGKLIEYTEFARFSRTLAMLLKNGASILDALKITSGVITNNAIKEDIEFIYNDVKAGLSLNSAIKKRGRFPSFISSMAAVGEEGGFLDKALLNIARNYERDLDRAVKTITTLLEPVFILVIGLAVGFIVVAMLLPVFEISVTVH